MTNDRQISNLRYNQTWVAAEFYLLQGDRETAARLFDSIGQHERAALARAS